MSDVDPKKMKVPELRTELKQRGLDSKGNKNQLVKRLEKALAVESGADPINESAQDESLLETTTEEVEDAETQPEPAPPEPEPQQKTEPIVEEPEVKSEPEPETKSEPEPETKSEPKPDPEPSEEPQEEEKPEIVKDEPEPQQEAPAAAAEEPTPEVKKEEGEPQGEAETPAAAEEPMEAGGDEPETDEGVPIEGEFQVMDSVGDTEGMEEDDKRGEKRRRSRSRDRDRYGRHHEEAKVPEEKDDWLEATNVQLDRYNSDLNLRIRDEGTKANPITVEGFAFMWAGARSNYGVNKGKVGFEVKVLEHLNVDHLPPEETHLHVVRVGWSTDSTSLQLGEEKLSYGYGGTGKASTDCKFEDYGSKFTAGDVIQTYMDFESEPMEITYSKNGEDLGKCFEVDKEALGEQALFPHFLSKNSEVEVNFGEKEEPFYPLKEGFTWITSVPVEERVRGSLPNTKKKKVPTATLR